MTKLACPNCSAPRELGARFCGACGIRLSSPDEPPQPGKPSVPVKVFDPPAREYIERASTDPVPGSAPRPAPPTPAAASALQNLLGTTLNGRYTVLKKIGEGGFGAVYEGKQIATGREVALKVLHPHNVSDATVVARFRREAEACSKLRSPYTVTLYDFDESEDGVLYLAMELVRGRSLQYLQRTEGPLSAVRALGILAQIADSLGEAHDKGIVHRDIKPENIMVERRRGKDFVKVLDFSIAKIVSGDSKNLPVLTAVGQTMGTLEFMSPEQLRGKPLDGRSDIYGLGMMCYEMLTGELPFGAAKAPTEIIKFHMHEQPPPPSVLNPELKIPAPLDELVLKMVAKSRDDRHANAAELREHIQLALASLDARAHRRELLRVVVVLGSIAAAVTTIILLVSG